MTVQNESWSQNVLQDIRKLVESGEADYAKDRRFVLSELARLDENDKMLFKKMDNASIVWRFLSGAILLIFALIGWILKYGK